MNISALIDAVASQVIQQSISFEELDIRRPLVLASADTKPVAGNVYVASAPAAETMIKRLRHTVPVTIIVAYPGGKPDALSSHGSNIIYVHMKLDELFNCLNIRLQEVSVYRTQCVEDALRSTAPVHLVKRCAEKLGGTVFLLNHNMEVIQAEGIPSNPSLIIRDIQIKGEFPFKTLCRGTQLEDILDESKIVNLKLGEICFVRAIATGPHIRFLLVVFLPTKLKVPVADTYIKICCDLIAAQFQREEIKSSNQSSALPNLLDYLSVNKTLAPEELRTKLNCLEKPIKRFYTTILVYADSKRIDFSLQRACQRLREVFPPHNVAVYDSNIVILFCKDSMFFKQDFNIDTLETLMEELGAFMIVCNALSNWNMLHVNYNLALSTMHIVSVMTESNAPPTQKRVFFYADYYGFIAIDMCRNALLKLGGTDDSLIYMGDPSVAHLAIHDNQNKDNLVNVLHKYLMAGGNISKASELLFMHRNTVQKKMMLIKELTQIDFDDPGIYFSLLFSCMVLQYYKHYLHRPLPVSLPKHTDIISLWPTYLLDL